MKNYTVVLSRPDYIADPYGLDVYVFQGEAEDDRDALRRAQQEVFDADTEDGAQPEDPSDYALIVGFEGICKPLMFPWGTL